MRMMRPVMSALMSTDVLASIFPLAVTALTSHAGHLFHPHRRRRASSLDLANALPRQRDHATISRFSSR
jgi:hypothetical protein